MIGPRSLPSLIACLCLLAGSARGQDDVDDAAQERLDAPVTLRFADGAPLAKVLGAIREAAGDALKVELDPSAKKKAEATVKLDVDGIPLKAALTAAARQAGLIYTVKGSKATLAPDTYKPPAPDELEARMKKVDATTYAPKYDEAKFRALKPGMTEAEVHQQLGRPLREVKAKPQTDWYYGPPTLRVTEDGGMFDSAGELATAWGYTIARAGADGKVVEFLGGYFPDPPAELIGADLAAVRKKYGEPLAVHATRATRYLIYAAPKGDASYRTRVVGLDADAKVVEVVAGYYFE